LKRELVRRLRDFSYLKPRKPSMPKRLTKPLRRPPEMKRLAMPSKLNKREGESNLRSLLFFARLISPVLTMINSS